MDYFVNKRSVVRKIWGKSDTILFIFAGASAEFAVNKAVDWLYFTGKLPSDPLGRLFSTVSYARTIVFSKNEKALRAIDSMSAIHANVEASRGMRIPDWAYRDVLFMLIDYSIRSYELLERKLTSEEKEEVFEVFNRVGLRMGINGLPESFPEWIIMREAHLNQDLLHSDFTHDLYEQYRKHLGTPRYAILKEAQTLVAPDQVNKLLGYRKVSLLKPLVGLYKLLRVFRADWMLKELLLPSDYKKDIYDLDTIT